jgi:uncharacterized phage-associated protein
MSSDAYMFETTKLSEYIVDSYLKKYDRQITAIKLQKVLYFLFAYWGAYVVNNDKGEVEEKFSSYRKYLFDADIYAWTYGPVVKLIYNNFHNGKLIGNKIRKSEEIFNDDITLKENIDGLMYELFEISDFQLVGMAHLDKCWKSKYNSDEKQHNNIMNKDDIINEYAIKTLQ